MTTNFEDLTGPELVKKYNWMADLVQKRNVSKFESRDSGIRRCRQLHADLVDRGLVEKEAPPKGVDSEPQPQPHPAGEAPMAAAAKAKAKVSTKSAPTSGRSSMKIKLLTKDNPRKPGTDAHRFFQHIARSATVGQYSAKFKDPAERRKALQWLSNTVRDGHAKVGS